MIRLTRKQADRLSTVVGFAWYAIAATIIAAVVGELLR